jgi:hypothetical protein
MISEKWKRWILLIALSAFLGVYTAEIVVYMPDWWADMIKFWVR